MKKIGVLAVVASLALSLAVFAGETSGNGKAKKGQTQSVENPSAKKGGGGGDATRIEKELTTLRAEHKAAMDQLLGIKKLATEEKAPKTAAALDKLMAQQEQQFQKRIAPLQQRVDKMKGAKTQGTESRKGGKRGNGKNSK